MPEGDVLRRVSARLDQALAGRTLVRAELRWPSAAGTNLVGRTVLANVPYGKHLLTRFDDGRTLHTHLRMDGRWEIARTGSSAAAGRSPRTRALLGAADWTALGHDLGMLDVVPTRDEGSLLGHLGPDVLADELDLDEILRRFAARGATPVAEVLLDQTVLAGLGTIYTAESLFAERLWPWLAADEVPDPRRLVLRARHLMQRAVAAGAAPGHVHGRLRMPCPRCGTPIAVGQARQPPMQRPIFSCPTCQPKPTARGAR
ncbi:DNA-formamidopyrimidine glycosylase family protein [Cellulomonas alba]|uniref:DNA-(apurinic or apyrimidinic site) lyase n=1 Tax=Cellulomonas alba TaxID=3053467 RepID=A0ABT7SIY9_9CELL|nr:DNA-formamidopyrimidine glycosylase family protein [Cellulomonas alba]MDM7856148.1 DNA-formamidopyrimidine glycosylase family protein [Cellulomonas alba]